MQIKARHVLLKTILFVLFGLYMCGGKYGIRCENTCSSTCYDVCDNQGNCQSCMSGYHGHQCEFECNCEFGCDQLQGHCLNEACPINCNGTCDVSSQTCYSCNRDGRNQQTEETHSGSVIGGAVGGVLGVCAVVALVVVVLVLKKKGIIWKESKKTYEDISPGRSQDEPYTTLASASTTEYEIPDSEPRSELTIEGEDNRVYYNDERAYYKNSRNGSCLSCVSGYYGYSCNMECQQNCASNRCHQNDGLCMFCPANCVSCESNTTCTLCKDSKYGEMCHFSCNEECTDKICNIKEVCYNCSSLSAFGSYCNLTCNHNCVLSTCDRNTGACSNCKNNSVFGMFCNEICSPYCLTNECNRESGVCLNRCSDGYFGTKCDQECSQGCRNNSGTICDPEGACLGGCTEGYLGKNANQVQISKCFNK
ncbi:multiple epidermal growth factor-like domains protein 10 [Mya arenaria]|uniref:multiple epidermal growth factor-like domains protein 10 n=1 Tax=Mya arenaria TaxID=6604 RepID=UPI0022E68A91|nr:multiple epidermal growth factor-like domains protein 10 [Mya arenaria]